MSFITKVTWGAFSIGVHGSKPDKYYRNFAFERRGAYKKMEERGYLVSISNALYTDNRMATQTQMLTEIPVHTTACLVINRVTCVDMDTNVRQK